MSSANTRVDTGTETPVSMIKHRPRRTDNPKISKSDCFLNCSLLKYLVTEQDAVQESGCADEYRGAPWRCRYANLELHQVSSDRGVRQPGRCRRAVLQFDGWLTRLAVRVLLLCHGEVPEVDYM